MKTPFLKKAWLHKKDPSGGYEMNSKYTITEMLRRMEESDLVRNIDKGEEYTGFKDMYKETMISKGLISRNGRVYDVSNSKDSSHLVEFLKRIENEEESPDVVMTSGSFLSMNRKLRKHVAKLLISLAKKGRVRLYAGENITRLFKKSNVQVTIFNREKYHIPHFIKSKIIFNFVLPHTEIKLVRVDLDSDMFDPEAKNRMLDYFDKLIADFDDALKNT